MNALYLQKLVSLKFVYLKICSALQMYFSLKYQLQTDSIWLFTEISPHKRILIAVPRLDIHINISLISTCLIHIRITFMYGCGPGLM